ncbi:hypothetical protein A2U01_0035186, partial [Trifolium medium]|nr:hypothetical protein [Trifolium medium]
MYIFLLDVMELSAAATLAHVGDSTACLSHSVGSWILDSSASDHVVGNPSLISNMLPPKIPHNITLPNGSKAQVTDRSTGKTIGTGFESHGLYYLNPHSSTVCGVSASPDIIHCRLGHPSLDKCLGLPSLDKLK